MNNQMQRGIHGSDQGEHRHGAAVHNPGLHSGVEHNAPHDEKKSVLQKVKAKAKKIKDTITKHGHHGDEHAHNEEDAHHHRRREVGAEYDYDEEEDNDEIEVDPEAHGAPIFPSVTAPQPTPQVAAPTMVGMGHYGTQHDAVAGGAHGTTTFSSPISVESPTAKISNTNPDLTREEHNTRDHKGFIPGQVGVSKHDDVVTFGGSQTHTGVGERPAQPTSPSLGYSGASGAHSGGHHGTNLPFSSGSSGTGHPHTGVGERPAQPTSPSLGYSGASEAHSGGHHGTNLPFSSGSSGTSGITDRLTDLERDPQALSGYQEPSNYQSKVQDPSRGGGEQMGITHVLHSLDKMAAHGDGTKQRQANRTRAGQEENMFNPNAGLADENRSVRTQRQTPYGATTGSHETSGELTATPGVTDTGISAKNAVASKLGFGGGDNTTGSHETSGELTTTPGVTDTGISAKNAVASKLGFGGGDNTSTTSSAIDTGNNVASTVYGAEAGGAVMSKMPGSHAAKQTVPENLSPGEEDKALSDVSTETLHKTLDKGEQHKEGEEDSTSKTSSSIDYGKNVASTVYEKLAEAGGAVMSKMPGPENLSPGEEDKALSDVSTETLHKTSDKGEQHKEGKVTFSAKVEKQLGIGGEDSAEDIDTGVSGPSGGEPMVNMLKDTVKSWLGIKHDPEPSSLVWHDIPKDTNEGLSEQYQQGPETERKGRLQ